MGISICHWWKTYFHNQFWTNTSCRDCKQVHRSWEISADHKGKNDCLAASSHNNVTIENDICQHTTPVVADQLQTQITPPFSHTRQLLGSMQQSTTDFASLPVKTNEPDFGVSVGSEGPQEGRMPPTDGTFGKGTTTPWSTGGGTESHAQGSTLLERRGAGRATLGIRKDEQEAAGGQGTTATDSSFREPHDRRLDQEYHEGRPHAVSQHRRIKKS